MSSEASIWRVQANGQVYETDLHTLKVWVCEGAVLATDKVAKGNLQWLEAGRVPVLRGVFSGAETLEQVLAAAPPPEPVPAAALPPTIAAPPPVPETVAAPPPTVAAYYAPPASAGGAACYLHPETPPRYICVTCQTPACQECVKFVGNVPLCAVCGELCRDFERVRQQVRTRSQQARGFGVSDLGFALGYPFRNAVTLFGAAAIYGLMTLIGLKGRLLALGLMFGFITRVIQQVSLKGNEAGRLFGNHDFMFYDDVIAPLGRGLCVTIITYGPLVALAGLLLTGYLGSLNKPDSPARPNEQIQAEAARSFDELVNANGETPPAGGGPATIPTPGATERDLDVLLDPEGDSAKQAEIMQRYDPLHAREYGGQPTPTPVPGVADNVLGEYAPLAQSLSFSAGLVILLAGTLFWALFYHPMALLIAGYTQNAGAVLNPLVGFDTLRYLGADYLKALALYILLLIVSGFASGLAFFVLSPFEMPIVGNLPARFVDGVITFYANLALACALGLLLYKCGDKLNLTTR